MWTRLRAFLTADRSGQALVEYALILCLVVVVLILVVMLMGNQVKNLYCNIAGGLGTS